MKRLKIALLLLVVVLLATGCSGNDKLTKMAKNAYQATESPRGVKDIYAYHFQGTDEINKQGDEALETAFNLSEGQMPENGYLFILSDQNSNFTFVLLNTNGNVLKSINTTKLMASVENMSDLAAFSKQANTDYENGLISDVEMQAKKTQLINEINRREALALQGKSLLSYAVSAALCEGNGKDTVNEWHKLTNEQVSQIQ